MFPVTTLSSYIFSVDAGIYNVYYLLTVYKLLTFDLLDLFDVFDVFDLFVRFVVPDLPVLFDLSSPPGITEFYS